MRNRICVCLNIIYIHSLTTRSEINMAVQYTDENLAFTQLGTKSGLKLWGQEGVESNRMETHQCHDLDIVRPPNPKKIAPKVKTTALNYLVFLKKGKF